jgi:uncharacterized protein involved in cysteine biosynthesis
MKYTVRTNEIGAEARIDEEALVRGTSTVLTLINITIHDGIDRFVILNLFSNIKLFGAAIFTDKVHSIDVIAS